MNRRRTTCPVALLFGAGVAAMLVFGGCESTQGRSELANEYYNIGTAYFDLGKFDKSAQYLARAIELSPALARASYNLARVYVEQQRYPNAIELLDELLAEDPTNVLVIETIAYAHYRAGDLADAGTWYDRALAVSPSDLDLLQNRADVAIEGKEYARAEEVLLIATSLTDKRPALWLRLARVETQLGAIDRAADAYATYMDSAPTPETAALLEYADVLEKQQYYADALATLRRVKDTAAATPEQKAFALFTQARLLLTVGQDADTGVESLKAALAQGFADGDAAAALLADDRLIARQDVEAIIAGANLATPESGAGTPSETDAQGGDGPPGKDALPPPAPPGDRN